MNQSNPNSQLILLVDDEADFREIFSMKLKAAGFVVELAEDGLQGIEKAKILKPDLILMDVKMPGMDGVEALSRIKADLSISKTKVVFLTSYGEPLPVEEIQKNDRKFAQELGAMDYIRKSDDLDEIVNVIKKILGKNSS